MIFSGNTVRSIVIIVVSTILIAGIATWALERRTPKIVEKLSETTCEEAGGEWTMKCGGPSGGGIRLQECINTQVCSCESTKDCPNGYTCSSLGECKAESL